MKELHTIVVRDSALQLFMARKRCICGVRHDVDESNAVQADHLLEIDIAPLVQIDILTERKTEVRAV